MSLINSKIEDGVLTLIPSGRIDSTNAPDIQAEIDEIASANPHDAVVLDAEDLSYISSAGLRIVLKLGKTEKNFEVVNANTEVYDIFDMTGFSEILTIKKAYRKFSVDGCEIIGKGAKGIVYRYDPETIVKVYNNSDSLPAIQRERELARKAFVLGVPTAISYDVVKVGDKYGSVFELLDAKSFAKLIAGDPDNLEKYIDIYAKLLKQIHENVLKDGELPDRKAKTLRKVRNLRGTLPDEQYEKLCGLVENLPEKNNMIHGDYHIKNVLMQNGEPTLIDMDTLSMGHPIFEFSAMYLAYIGYGETDHSNISDFLGIPFEFAEKIWHRSLEVYFDTTDKAKISEIENRSALVGYASMLERLIRKNYENEENGKANYDLCIRRIAELLPKIDNLDF